MKRFWRICPVFFILLFLAVSCQENPPIVIEEKGFIYLGFVVPQSGPLKSIGQGIIRAAELRVSEINNDGGINGRLLKILVEDESGLKAIPDSGRLANDPRITAIIGHLREDALESSRRMYIKAGLPVLLPFISRASASTDADGRFFRTMPKDADQARALAEYAVKNSKTGTLVALHDGSEYGMKLAQVFSKAATDLSNGKTHTKIITYDSEKTKELTAELIKTKPDAVFLALPRNTAVAAAKEISDSKIKTNLLGTHTLAFKDTVGFLTQSKSAVYLVLPFDIKSKDVRTKAVLEKFKQNLHERPTWPEILAYDAVSLAAEALASGNRHRESMVLFLNGLNGGKRVFKGAGGEYYFKPQGQGVKSVYITRVDKSLINHVP